MGVLGRKSVLKHVLVALGVIWHGLVAISPSSLEVTAKTLHFWRFLAIFDGFQPSRGSKWPNPTPRAVCVWGSTRPI